MQGKNNGEEENRGQHLQSSFALLEYLPKSIFYILYTISKLRKSRIQRFKPCMIWSWNEEDMAFGRQLHHLEKISQGDFLHGAKFGPFIFPLAKFPLFLHASTTDFPDICSLIFSHVNSFCNLVFSLHKALSCNFAIHRGAQHLQNIELDIGGSILCTLT